MRHPSIRFASQCFVISTVDQAFNRMWSVIWLSCGSPLGEVCRLKLLIFTAQAIRIWSPTLTAFPACHSLGAQIADPPPGYFRSVTVLCNHGARSKQVHSKPLHRPPGTPIRYNGTIQRPYFQCSTCTHNKHCANTKSSSSRAHAVPCATCPSIRQSSLTLYHAYRI